MQRTCFVFTFVLFIKSHLLFPLLIHNGSTIDETFLLSCPRSGNTWLRYCLEFLTKKPTAAGCLDEKTLSIKKSNQIIDHPLSDFFPLGANTKALPIIKAHGYIRRMDLQQDTLIFLIRNYKELIFRRFALKIVKESFDDYKTKTLNTYFGCLKLYDNWNPDNRIIIYYEDLITHPQRTLKTLLDFLHVEPTYLDSLMQNYEYHKNCCIKFYNGPADSTSKASSIKFHTKNISLKTLLGYDQLVQKINEDLSQKYLTRYFEKQSN